MNPAVLADMQAKGLVYFLHYILSYAGFLTYGSGKIRVMVNRDLGREIFYEVRELN